MRVSFFTILPYAASGLILLVAMGNPAVAGSDPDFGCTVKRNIETQTVDMDPQYAGTLMEGGVGRRSGMAVRRYMTDNIRPFVRFGAGTAVGAQGGANTAGSASAAGGGGN